jgi:hypothetical protein
LIAHADRRSVLEVVLRVVGGLQRGAALVVEDGTRSM